MDLPESLHGQLFLLACERKTHRFLTAAVAGRRTDPRTTSVGLLARIGELPALPDIGPHTFAAAAPVVGAEAAARAVYDVMREQGPVPDKSAGGCGGCGG